MTRISPNVQQLFRNSTYYDCAKRSDDSEMYFEWWHDNNVWRQNNVYETKSRGVWDLGVKVVVIYNILVLRTSHVARQLTLVTFSLSVTHEHDCQPTIMFLLAIPCVVMPCALFAQCLSGNLSHLTVVAVRNDDVITAVASVLRVSCQVHNDCSCMWLLSHHAQCNHMTNLNSQRFIEQLTISYYILSRRASDCCEPPAAVFHVVVDSALINGHINNIHVCDT